MPAATSPLAASLAAPGEHKYPGWHGRHSGEVVPAGDHVPTGHRAVVVAVQKEPAGHWVQAVEDTAE